MLQAGPGRRQAGAAPLCGSRGCSVDSTRDSLELSTQQYNSANSYLAQLHSPQPPDNSRVRNVNTGNFHSVLLHSFK